MLVLLFPATGVAAMSAPLLRQILSGYYPDFYASQQVKISPPFNTNIVTTAPAGGAPAGFANPWIDYPGGKSPFPLTFSKNTTYPTNAGWVLFPPYLPAVYVNQWNFSIQRQVGPAWLLTANYMGSEATHILSSIEANPAVYLAGATCNINGTNFTPCSSVNSSSGPQ